MKVKCFTAFLKIYTENKQKTPTKTNKTQTNKQKPTKQKKLNETKIPKPNNKKPHNFAVTERLFLVGLFKVAVSIFCSILSINLCYTSTDFSV